MLSPWAIILLGYKHLPITSSKRQAEPSVERKINIEKCVPNQNRESTGHIGHWNTSVDCPIYSRGPRYSTTFELILLRHPTKRTTEKVMNSFREAPLRPKLSAQANFSQMPVVSWCWKDTLILDSIFNRWVQQAWLGSFESRDSTLGHFSSVLPLCHPRVATCLSFAHLLFPPTGMSKIDSCKDRVN